LANIVPEDEALFIRIEKEHIQVPDVLWNVIYQYIGDPITVISMLVRFYTDDGRMLPKEEARQILDYTRRMITVMEMLELPQTIPADEKDPLFREIKEKNLKLDPVTHHLFRNYARNDIYMINLIVGDYVDPLDKREAVSLRDASKILEHIYATMHFMDRLRVATARKEAY
jgi:hypothetical protein